MRGVQEDAYDAEDARNQQVDAKQPHQEDQRGSRGHQQDQPQQSGDNPFNKDQPPRKGFTRSTSVTTHIRPPACLRSELIPIMGTEPSSRPVLAQRLILSPLFTGVRGIVIPRTSPYPDSRKFVVRVHKD